MEVNRFSQKKSLFEGFSLFAIILLLFLIVITSLSTGAPILIVLIGFSPTLITIIVCILIFEEISKYRVMLWFLPFIFAGIFFFVMTGQSFLGQNLKVGTLTAINIILSIVYLGAFLIFMKSFDVEKKKKPVKIQKPISIREYVSSIEDKSKAINFVIGRVYSKYHGGSKELRSDIQIPPEWYNEFSDATKDDNLKDHKKLLLVLDKVEQRLQKLRKTEMNVFGSNHITIKELDRAIDGSDAIIKVLINNDKDPVESYYKGALDFCSKLRNELEYRKNKK